MSENLHICHRLQLPVYYASHIHKLKREFVPNLVDKIYQSLIRKVFTLNG